MDEENELEFDDIDFDSLDEAVVAPEPEPASEPEAEKKDDSAEEIALLREDRDWETK